MFSRKLFGGARIAVLVTTALLAAGCSSGASAGGAAPSAVASTSNTADTAKFQTIVDQGFANLKIATFPGPATPVTVPAGSKTIAVIQCDATLGGCRIPAEGAAKALKAIGWKVNLLNGQGQTQRFNRLISQAVSEGVAGIITNGIDPHLASQGLADAAAAHIPVVSISQGAIPSAGGVTVDVSPDTELLGRYLGAYAVVKAEGKAHALALNDNEYVTSVNSTIGFMKAIKECKDCKLEPQMEFISADISTSLKSRLISYLTIHPDVNWIFSPYDPAVTGAICPALVQAGLVNKVKVVSLLGLQANLDMVTKGECQVADGTWPQEWNGWAGVDQLIRLVAKAPSADPADEGLPLVLLDKEHMLAGGYTGISAGYDKAYLSLWGKG